jgi:hypothetical protein
MASRGPRSRSSGPSSGPRVLGAARAASWDGEPHGRRLGVGDAVHPVPGAPPGGPQGRPGSNRPAMNEFASPGPSARSTLRLGKLPPALLERLLRWRGVKDRRVLVGPGCGVDAAVVRIGPRGLVLKSDRSRRPISAGTSSSERERRRRHGRPPVLVPADDPFAAGHTTLTGPRDRPRHRPGLPDAGHRRDGRTHGGHGRGRTRPHQPPTRRTGTTPTAPAVMHWKERVLFLR